MIYAKKLLSIFATTITLMFANVAQSEQQKPLFSLDFLPKFQVPKQDNTQKDLPQIACIAVTMYGEAKGTSDKSLLSVAYVIINRTNHPKFPKNACTVVLQPGQMNPIETDGKLRKIAKQAAKGQVTQSTVRQYAHYMKIAKQAYYKQVADPTHGATHFYSPSLVQKMGYGVPNWAYTYTYTGTFAGQKYYRM